MVEPLVLIPVLFPVFFAAIWCFVLRILSWASGWTRLAKRYGTYRFTATPELRSASARFGACNYNAALRINADSRALEISTWTIFRPFHRPLRIPWSEIRAEAIGKTLLSGCRLTFSDVPGVSCVVYGRTLEYVRPHLASGSDDA